MGMMDVEKGSIKSAPIPDYYSQAGEPSYEETTIIHASWPRAMVNSFKRDPNLALTSRGVIGANGRDFDPEMAAVLTATSPLARKLKSRHLQMIAIGGSIGTGLFVASGKALYVLMFYSLSKKGLILIHKLTEKLAALPHYSYVFP